MAEVTTVRRKVSKKKRAGWIAIFALALTIFASGIIPRLGGSFFKTTMVGIWDAVLSYFVDSKILMADRGESDPSAEFETAGACFDLQDGSTVLYSGRGRFTLVNRKSFLVGRWVRIGKSEILAFGDKQIFRRDRFSRISGNYFVCDMLNNIQTAVPC